MPDLTPVESLAAANRQEFERLNQEVASLVATVKEHMSVGDRSGIDEDALTNRFMQMMNERVSVLVADGVQKFYEKVPRKHQMVGRRGFMARSLGEVQGFGRFDGLPMEDILFTHSLMQSARRRAPERVKAYTPEFEQLVQHALTSTGSGTGDEFVPTGMAATLWRDINLASRVASAFQEIAMPYDPFDSPVGWGDITWRKGTQNSATTVSNPATAKSTLTSTEQVAEINWSYNLDEDSVIAILPTLREDMIISGAAAADAFMMNADATNAATGNINSDDEDPADDSYFLSDGQDGLRHQVLVDNTAQSADISTTLTDALLLAALGKMGKYGILGSHTNSVAINKLVLFTNPKTYLISMLGLANIRTWDKYGPLASIVSGEAAKWSGIPVVPTSSIALAEDDGKIGPAGGTMDEGTVIIANRHNWRVGYRRQLLIELDRLIQQRTFVMVLSFRMAVAARGTRSTATHTAGVHGITYA